MELLDAATGLPTATVQRPEGKIHTIAFSPDGRTIALAMNMTMIWLWAPHETGVDPRQTEEIMVEGVMGAAFGLGSRISIPTSRSPTAPFGL